MIDQVEQPPTLQKILDNHAAVFDGTLGCMKDVEVTLQVKTEVKPKFLRPRKVPYILKQKVEEELDRLSNLGIIAPAELLMGRRPRAALDNLRPDVSQKVEHKQAKQKLSHDSNAPLRTFQIGDAVFAENFTGKSPKWISGVIAEVTGPLSYTVKFSDETTVRRHVDSIRKRTCPDSSDKSSTVDPLAFPYPCVPNPTPAAPPPERLHDPPPNPTPRRSTRVRHPPERFGL